MGIGYAVEPWEERMKANRVAQPDSAFIRAASLQNECGFARVIGGHERHG